KLGRAPQFITGCDTRESGAWIEKAFHAGAKAEGAACESAQVITTPGVAFLTKRFDFDAGIVISASHNPFHDNGIKIFAPTGKKIDGETEREIEKDIFSGQWSVVSGQLQDEEQLAVDSLRSGEFQTAYLDYLAEEFKNLRLENF